MSTYIVEIKGTVKSLQQFENMVEAEENTSAKFLKSSTSYHEGAITNLLTFEELEGKFLNKLKFIEGKAPDSDGVVPEWGGVLLINGKLTVAAAIRT